LKPLYATPVLGINLERGQQRLFTLKQHLSPVGSESPSAKGYREILRHEIGVPSALTCVAVRVLIRQQQMSLMTLATGMCRAVLADNLGIPFTLVLLKADKAFLHS
jgi:hypothetical protein